MESEVKRIVEFIRSRLSEYGFKGAVLGVSGGIDSAVVLALLLKALDRKQIAVFILPERDSSPESTKDAKLVCKHFDVGYTLHPITGILKALGIYKLQPPAYFIPWKVKAKYALKRWEDYAKNKTPYETDVTGSDDQEFLNGLAYYRAKHRVRMVYLYKEAERRNYAVIGTTNRTEFLTGLYVKWGDDATDIEPLLHLYKTEIFEMAKFLKVPEKIIKKPATPDLIPGLTDEKILGMSYFDIDRLLSKIETGESLDNEDEEMVKKVKKLIEMGERRNRIRLISLERL
ncbi:NAD(+) synthase [Thermosipho ferrireducens]|uniref:NH(3)-dependent NAD(+) synthetase n=1 Tax=Thermosipho ferrireducens TaxID=2571116 RepID=A0ABX7S8Q0_9BACT|nr:NAD(+) synthase [Thermosipho ferrireducens]QTA38968.1 NAD(+) synthase [Thermosipho ferrireducens]